MLVQLPNPKILMTPYHYSAVWDAPSGARKEAEFAAGRFCASKALEAMHPGSSYAIKAFPNGSPQWPEGIVGSITHTEGFVSAAVAGSLHTLGLGMDSEKLPAPNMLEALDNLVVLDREQRLLDTLSLSRPQGRTLVFSAKESVYKCLHPLVQRPFEYSAICLESIDVTGGTFIFRLTESLHGNFAESFRAQGRFEFSFDCVHTAVELENQ